MKAQDLWAGTEYAWCPERPRGVETPTYCVRVRVIKVFQKRDWAAERASTKVEVIVVEDKEYQYGSHVAYPAGKHLEVRARDIVDFWDEYKERLDVIEAERTRKERERHERQAKETAMADKIRDALALRGLNRDAIVVRGRNVIIEQDEIEGWLGLTAEPTTNQFFH